MNIIARRRRIKELERRADEHEGKAKSAHDAGLRKKAEYHMNEFCRLVREATELRGNL